MIQYVALSHIHRIVGSFNWPTATVTDPLASVKSVDRQSKGSRTLLIVAIELL